ncbi:ABC transporter permease subunit [Shewanella marina]|uniref:ABC transporter permease subunit n=1 Tax=Shewanella marina TaxID=487319 RepID=UPI0004715EDC|nr:ABC transporter permease subunit [Shewanella marina]
MEHQADHLHRQLPPFLVAKSNRRRMIEKLTQVGVTLGGVLVFVALLMIFLYLLYVVKPIFDDASVKPITEISLQASAEAPLMLGFDEQNQIVYRVSTTGAVSFYDVVSHHLISDIQIPLATGVKVVSSSLASASEQLYALGLSNGEVLIAAIKFSVSYPNNQRQITPVVDFPLAAKKLVLAHDVADLSGLVFGYNPQQVSLVYQLGNDQWQLTRFNREANITTDTAAWTRVQTPIAHAPKFVTQQLMTPDQRQLLLQSGDNLFVYDIQHVNAIRLLQVIDIKRDEDKVSMVSLLAGASSVLVTYQSGEVRQYFQVSSEHGRMYQFIRHFDNTAHVATLATEFYRKTFATISPQGLLGLWYTTSNSQLLNQQLALTHPQAMAFSPRSNALVIEANNKLHLYQVENSHPEVSWSALWQKVWYESYPEPQYVWQSTSATEDFEAKLSLTPLVFGTMKAALYAMLFATPLAIAGAIYTAYFMSAKLRNVVKPTIEIMEALPTVILGFLAGLWLAPLVEDNLPAILLLLVLLPVSILCFAFAWFKLPLAVKQKVPELMQELMLIPLVLLVGWLSFKVSPLIETWLFDGDTRQFITHELGFSFNQRNALIVGIAMGFAVIPTIFSIAEDAIYSVPRHLSNGSLALGATQWQTLTRVVLLTASPGIFSAVMMGLGRAVGETMIVLMATGNTGIMKWSAFEGMRTLAANIAVEMPESAIASSHYRVLFLAAFVLFIFTFVFNTVAEVVRQRLRERYSAL